MRDLEMDAGGRAGVSIDRKLIFATEHLRPPLSFSGGCSELDGNNDRLVTGRESHGSLRAEAALNRRRSVAPPASARPGTAVVLNCSSFQRAVADGNLFEVSSALRELPPNGRFRL